MNINKQINANLKIIYSDTSEKYIYDLVDENNSKLMSKTKGENIANEMVNNDLIGLNNEFITLTSFGKDIHDNGGWLVYQETEKEREILEHDLLSSEVEQIKKIIKNYPKTKIIAGIGIIISALLLFLELYKLTTK